MAAAHCRANPLLRPALPKKQAPLLLLLFPAPLLLPAAAAVLALALVLMGMRRLRAPAVRLQVLVTSCLLLPQLPALLSVQRARRRLLGRLAGLGMPHLWHRQIRCLGPPRRVEQPAAAGGLPKLMLLG